VRLLVLGGTKFLGRAAVEEALARGHEVTLFNRGETNPELFPEVKKLRGDRTESLEPLARSSWDAVIDPSGYLPAVVRASAEALAGSVGHYVFVSSVSVYASLAQPVDEDAPLAELGDDPDDRLTDDYSNYGALKALCEDAVRQTFDERALVVRPGLIVGPHHPTGRFTYWPHRVARGGEMLAPAPPDRLSQFVDVRDLGEWIVELCERSVSGTFNAANEGVPWGDLLASCVRVSGADVEIAWASDDFLLGQKVGQWMELPLWLADADMAAADDAIVARAVAGGLRFRPLDETVRGALEGAETTDEAGLSAEREAALLAAWHGR
jgi:2'-hydroxyisoflavone reductase